MDSKHLNAQMNDLMRDPKSFGAPTFEEFKRNREKYVGRDDDKITQVDKGSSFHHKIIDKYEYEIEGYRCKSLEEVERVAAEQGIALRELDYRPEFIPQGGGKANMRVKFVSKSDRVRREAWSNGEKG